MQRIIAALLLLAASLAQAAPLLLTHSLPVSKESKLPPCCRKDGKHRCAMRTATHSGEASGATLQSLATHCDSYPGSFALPILPQVALSPSPLALPPPEIAGPLTPSSQLLFLDGKPTAANGRAPPSTLL